MGNYNVENDNTKEESNEENNIVKDGRVMRVIGILIFAISFWITFISMFSIEFDFNQLLNNRVAFTVVMIIICVGAISLIIAGIIRGMLAKSKKVKVVVESKNKKTGKKLRVFGIILMSTSVSSLFIYCLIMNFNLKHLLGSNITTLNLSITALLLGIVLLIVGIRKRVIKNKKEVEELRLKEENLEEWRKLQEYKRLTEAEKQKRKENSNVIGIVMGTITIGVVILIIAFLFGAFDSRTEAEKWNDEVIDSVNEARDDFFD